MYWWVLNFVRKLIKLPFALVFGTLFLIIGFFCTDWTNESDRRNWIDVCKAMYW